MPPKNGPSGKESGKPPEKPRTARSLAMTSLLALERDGRYSNLEVDARLKSAALSPADRALYTRLVYGVTERRITLDWIIGRYSSRGAETLDPDVRCALRMGIYQLLWTDRIPEHAAVDESVNLVPQAARGYVNAVLRAFLRAEKRIEWPDRADGGGLPYFSVKYSVPESLAAIYRDALDDPEELADLLEALNREPHVGLRVNTMRLTAGEAAARTGGRLSETAPDLILLDSLTPDARAGLDEGLWFVQDEASRIVSAAVGALPGERVIDVCACPGGKSFSMALDMHDEGEILSFDLHANKLSLVEKGAAKLGLSAVHAAARDARDPDPSLIGTADRVLCDAPCSGLGVIAKKPDVRYKDPAAFARLPGIQREILDGASRYVKPGGVLVYSTCTLNRAENEETAAAFLAAHPAFEAEESRVFLPHRDGCDGFFMAKMRRKAMG